MPMAARAEQRGRVAELPAVSQPVSDQRGAWAWHSAPSRGAREGQTEGHAGGWAREAVAAGAPPPQGPGASLRAHGLGWDLQAGAPGAWWF